MQRIRKPCHIDRKKSKPIQKFPLKVARCWASQTKASNSYYKYIQRTKGSHVEIIKSKSDDNDL